MKKPLALKEIARTVAEADKFIASGASALAICRMIFRSEAIDVKSAASVARPS